MSSSLRLALKASLADSNLDGNRHSSSQMSSPLSSLNLPRLPSCSGEQNVEAEIVITAASIISSPTSVSSKSSSSSGNQKCESSSADHRLTNSSNNDNGKRNSNNAAFSLDNNVDVEAPASDGNVETKDIARTINHSTSKQTIVAATTKIQKNATVAAASSSSSSSNSLSFLPNETLLSSPTPTTPTTTTTTTTATQRRHISAPMIYITITLQRNPNKVQSWGLVFTKEKYSILAYIIRVTPPPKTTTSSSNDDGGPIVTQFQITTTTNNNNSTTQQQYTSFDNNNMLLYTEYILPGDGIYSINGINVSSFITTHELSSYIRKECTAQITFVIMRHESVWRAVYKCQHDDQLKNIMLLKKNKLNNNTNNNNDNNTNDNNKNNSGSSNNLMSGEEMMVECVSKSVNNAWRWVLAPIISNNSSNNSVEQHHHHHQQLYYSNSCKYATSNNRPPTTTNTTTTTVAMKRPREDEIEIIDDNGDTTTTTTVIHDFWLVNGHATFGAWHEATKSKWLKSYSWNKDKIDIEDEDMSNNVVVVHDFWLINDMYDSFHSWHATSKAKWARSYSWHKTRRNDFQMKCEKEVHFPTVAIATLVDATTTTTTTTTSSNNSNNTLVKFENWLGVRKNQWKVERRKRQRCLLRRAVDTTPHTTTTTTISFNVNNNNSKMQPTTTTTSFVGNVNDMYIDDMLQDQEEQQHASLDGRRTSISSSNDSSCCHYYHQPIDILWIFDSQLGAPDDVIANLMTYLNPCDHGSLLCLSFTTNTLFKQRDDMWQSLFPTHWIVPRRPRQSWCTMYITKIRAEEVIARKRSETVLLQANELINKGDQLHKLEKLLCKAIKEFDFSINYTSGVVLERNSILNLSVIARRHKITKWLIETQGADIESFDRGNFTPLMNSAWNGDKYITRYLLSKKCDRSKIGYYHSSKGIAPPSFEGLTAEGWACKCGHDDVAELIYLGL